MEKLFWRSFLQRRIQQTDFLALDSAQIALKALLISAPFTPTATDDGLGRCVVVVTWRWSSW